MGIVFRQSLKASIAVLGGALLGGLINYFGPKYIPTDDLGFRNNFIAQSAVLQFIILLGVQATLQTFLPRYPQNDTRRKVLFTTGLITATSACLIFSIPYFLLRHWVVNHFQIADRPAILRFYNLLPLLVLIWSLITLTEAWLIAEMKTALSAFMREVVLRVGNLVVIFLFACRYISFDAFIYGTIATYVLPLAGMLLAARTTKGFGVSFHWNVFNKLEWKEILHFSWYHLLSGISISLVGFLDQLILAPLDKSGMNAVAIYAIAVFVSSMASLPVRSMAVAAFPVLNAAYISGDDALYKRLFHRSGINMLIAGSGMIMLIIINLPTALRLYPLAYTPVFPLALILLIGKGADLITGMNTEVLSISSHYKFLFRISALLSVLLVISCRILIPRFGFYGAAWSATLSLVIFNLVKAIFLWRKFGLHPFSIHTLKVLVAALSAIMAVMAIPHVAPVFGEIFLRSSVAGSIYVAILIWLKPSEDFSGFLKNIRLRRRLF